MSSQATSSEALRGPLALAPRKVAIHLRMIAQASRYRMGLFLTTIGLIGSTITVVVTPRLVGWAIDSGLGIDRGTKQVEGNMNTLLLAGLLLMLAAVARGAFVYLQTYMGERVSQAVAYDLRNDIYDHLQRLSYAYHDDAQIGQIMSRATQDVEGVRFFVSMGLIRFAYIIILVAVTAYLMLQTNLVVALVGLAFVPVVAIAAAMNSLKLRPVWLQVQDLQGQLSTILQENLTGQRVVKAFGRSDFEEQKFDQRARLLFDFSYMTSRIQAFQEPAMNSLWLLSLALVFWVGGREIIAGRMTIGDMAMFQLYLTLLQVPVRSVGFVVNIFARAQSSGERIYEILDAESAVQEKPGAPPLRANAGDVIFEDVSFGYDAVSPVLRHIDVHARPGEMVALLGPTGSGKSTVVHLLPRFYDVTAGAIRIDGQDIRDVTLDSLRSAIGIVQQDVFLFAATIGENIAYGRPGATQAEIETAAKAARMHDFIMQMPDGYDTWVGERGATLSGGQRQRVAIARTLLLDPRVLVFDDSTSSVDMRTEFEIQEALQNLMRGRTTFVIAQRLRTVQQADQILVMRDGVIVERGRHAELLEAGGFYREIYDLELRDQEEARAASEVLSSAAAGDA
ncbi:MAG: ABC transporter ATP-binding protein [Dehalococcoidia bacterium]|nr:ABC transporter ATP-binding protein [Dehalococcoidia bacterium]